MKNISFLNSEYRSGILASGPFAPNALVFGTIVGVASREAGQEATELILSAFTVNAAMSQLAALEFWRGVLGFSSVLVAVIFLNAKHLLYGASLWSQFQRPSCTELSLIGFTLTDSSWICCQLAAQRGILTPRFAIANGWTLLAIWVSGCIFGFYLGTLISPDLLQRIGAPVIGVLSMAALAPKTLRSSKHLLAPGILAGVTSLVLYLLKFEQGLAILIGTFMGALLVSVSNEP